MPLAEVDLCCQAVCLVFCLSRCYSFSSVSLLVSVPYDSSKGHEKDFLMQETSRSAFLERTNQYRFKAIFGL